MAVEQNPAYEPVAFFELRAWGVRPEALSLIIYGL